MIKRAATSRTLRERFVLRHKPNATGPFAMKRASLVFTLCCTVVWSLAADDWATTGKGGSAGDVTAAQAAGAWAEMVKYEAGQDQKALLTMNWVVINAMNDPKQRAATAARLASLLNDPNTTSAARQFICTQLYRIGTEAEVPAVAPLLVDAATTDTARLFLERVRCEASRAALRQALERLEGRALIGVVNSLSLMHDEVSVNKIFDLTKSQDSTVARAAWRALGNFGNDSAAAFLVDALKNADEPAPAIESAAVRAAILRAAAGKQEQAMEIYRLLADARRSPGARQAGCQAVFASAAKAEQATLIAQWSKSPDSAHQKVVISHLAGLSDEFLEKVLRDEATGAKVQGAVVEELAVRQGEKLLPAMLAAANSGDPVKVRLALRCLAAAGDPQAIPALIKALRAEEATRQIAADALGQLPREIVGPALLQALNEQPEIREPVVGILAKLKYYEAIDLLVKLAGHADPAVYEGAVAGLRAICDPDVTDLKRMFALYLDVPAGAQRDCVQRAIAFICEKDAKAADRATILLGLVDRHPHAKQDTFQAAVLPLLGRLGTEAVYQRIEPLLDSPSPELSAAAVRALCNWPTAEHAEAIWELAAKSKSEAYRSQALRAYVRVVTLPSQRPEKETLAMLQKAMKFAESNENKNWALSRAAAVRSLETVDWAAGYLDDPDLAQTACQVIVELAHHRFLRQPNKAHFEPILRKVETTAKDKSLARLAEKARLGM